MNRSASTDQQNTLRIHHPRFAAYYERVSQSKSERRFVEPLRRELIGQAHGLVLEIGAGTGLNFPFYPPEKVTRVEALEPDASMLAYARKRLSQAHVPINLSQAPAETLPFADASFDCVVATLVFCSVNEPARSFQEIRRVLKPGGTLLLGEHVRSAHRLIARLQDWLVPFTTRLAGNCHWNRATRQTLLDTGFQINQERDLGGGLIPIVLLQATNPL